MEPKDPHFPEISLVKKTESPIEYDLESKLRNVRINIPLLQSIRDIPIYTKTIWDLCIKKPRRKKNNNQAIKVIIQMSEMIS